MIYTTDAYLVTCLTHLHVGSGGTNYGVVDNLVQRDPISGIPIINGSSLKGALREYFHHLSSTKSIPSINDALIDHVFGPDDKRSGSSSKKGIGHFKFFEGQLLVLPVRSTKKPFFRATCPHLIDAINIKSKGLNCESTFSPINEIQEDRPLIQSGVNIQIDNFKASPINNTEDFPKDENLGKDVALFNDNDFKKIIRRLPVIARNKLQNGESKNLWYEEVVPRESRFVFFVSKPVNDGYANYFDAVFDGSHTIQIGANASIGYGFTNIKKL